MAVIPVRTIAEAREFMVLELPECGDRLTLEPVRSYPDGDRWVHQYEAGCAELGVRREFEFTVDPKPAGEEAAVFGDGRQPSRLIDAGEWYLVSSRYLQAGAAAEKRFQQEPRPDLVEEAYEYYARASAALLEVLKFIPPGAAAPPDPAFWTDRGRSVREQVGDQLVRSVLEPAKAQLDDLLRAYREAYARGT